MNKILKNINLFLSLPLVLLTVFALSGCFSHWKGDETRIILFLSGGSPALSRSADYPPDDNILNQLEHTVKLTNGMQEITLNAKGGAYIDAVVPAGLWNIWVDTYLENIIYASGFAEADIQPGKENIVRVTMYQAYPTDGPPDYQELTYGLQNSLNWISLNAKDGGKYVIIVNRNETIYSQSLSYNNATITLRGDDTERFINLNGYGSMFCVYQGVTLILDNNITLIGRDDNYCALVEVDGGSLIMNDGAKITKNRNSDYGGGVHIINGKFTMNGGTISGNTADYGGGVYAGYNVFFKKTGGTIFGYTNDNDGNVVMDINGDVLSDRGHAVYIDNYNVDKNYKENTAGPSDDLLYDGTVEPPKWDGDW